MNIKINIFLIFGHWEKLTGNFGQSKSNNMDSSKSMKELEIYMQDLTSDMMELLEKASPEEKAIVQKKINTLASKIQNV